jgi:hypothetical protein
MRAAEAAQKGGLPQSVQLWQIEEQRLVSAPLVALLASLPLPVDVAHMCMCYSVYDLITLDSDSQLMEYLVSAAETWEEHGLEKKEAPRQNYCSSAQLVVVVVEGDTVAAMGMDSDVVERNAAAASVDAQLPKLQTLRS